MALSMKVAGDIVNALLPLYMRGKTYSQTMQSKPLLKALGSTKKTFPGGKDSISTPVQGRYMEDTPGFIQGYSEDDALNFSQAANVLRASYNWKEVAFNLWITWTELKKGGITVTEHNKTSAHSQQELFVLTDVLQNRLDDFAESMARAKNKMFWRDGSTDPKLPPGLTSIITDTPTTGTTGGLDRSNPDGANGTWWQHIALIGDKALVASPSNQTLTKGLRYWLIQACRYGGKPKTALAGSAFIDSLFNEVSEKGIYTQQGFVRGKNDIGMDTISITVPGVNLTFEYDPTLDDMGMSKRCYFIDTSKLRVRPMEQEEDKVLNPERPYNYLVFLRNVTWTGGMECFQLNAQMVAEVK